MGKTPLPLPSEADLYRIAQEALTNVRQHAHAITRGSCAAALRQMKSSSRSATMGVVSTADASATATITGSIGMRERARLLGGQLRVASRPGRGTTVTARVPLPDEAES